jgi:hypothetical protein
VAELYLRELLSSLDDIVLVTEAVSKNNVTALVNKVSSCLVALIGLGNILLEYKTGRRETSRKDNLALGLITVGILSFIIMMVIGKLIPDGGLIHDIFFYISDIAATVTIWEALYILLVEDHEHRFYKRGLLRRFKEIRVHTD